MLGVIVLILSSFTSLLLGYVVFLRNPKQKSSQAFFALSFSIAAWSVTNFLTDVERLGIATNDVTNRLAYFFAFLAVYFGLRFAMHFIQPTYVGYGRKIDQFTQFVCAIVAVLSLTSWVAGEVQHKNGELSFTLGPLIGVYVAVFLYILILIFLYFKKIMDMKRGHVRQQALYILLGFLVTALLGLITNVIIPILTKNWSTTVVGPIFTVLLVSVISYAIVKHKLFDIRLVVVRSLTYALSIAFIVALYALVSFGLLSTLFDFQISIKEELILSAFSAVTALLFQPLKHFFDINTSKLFYRDAYDPEIFYDQLNKVVVSNIELDNLLSEVSLVISNNLKTAYCVIGVKDNTESEFRVVGTQKKSYRAKDIEFVRSRTIAFNQQIIVTDNLDDDQSELREVLTVNDISVLARLTSEYSSNIEGMGYIVLGPKKSGNPFTDQDMRILESVANELIIALQNALRFEEIERFNETLQRQVEDATRKLKASNLKLKKLNDTKDDFISMTSHQLRTPLTTIKGYVSLVMDEDAGPVNDAQRKLLTQAFGSAQRLVYMVADLLNVSRLKTGKFVIERTPTDLSTIIDDELGQLKAEASLRNLKLEYKMPKKFPILPLDETKTRQVIMNFLDNAIYYTPSGGKIRAELVEKDDSVEFLVIDNGIGVPKEERHHLFSKFYRAKNAQRARPDGTGLGLYMAQKVVVAQGGYIIFNSEEGKGSTFGFHFPKDMPEGQVTLPAQAPSGGLDG